MNIIQRNTNENIWLDLELNQRSLHHQPGIELEIPTTLVRFFTTEVSWPISTVQLVQTTTFLPFTKSSPPKTYNKHKCQDLLNTNAWSRKAKAPNVVEKGGINIYEEVPVQMKINYHISRNFSVSKIQHFILKLSIKCQQDIFFHEIHYVHAGCIVSDTEFQQAEQPR